MRDLPVASNHKKRYGGGFDRESDGHRLEWLPSFAAFCWRVNTLNDDTWHGLSVSLFDTLHALAIMDQAKHHVMVSMRTRRKNVVRECTQLQALRIGAETCTIACRDWKFSYPIPPDDRVDLSCWARETINFQMPLHPALLVRNMMPTSSVERAIRPSGTWNARMIDVHVEHKARRRSNSRQMRQSATDPFKNLR